MYCMEINQFGLGAYLGRVGYRGPLVPTLETLTALHEAHQAAIPFENLDILLGRSILLDLPALVAKLIEGGRGGYCFEHNTLFRAALEAAGFRVTSLAARVRLGAHPGEIRPRSHMLLLVELPQGPFVADVGFGGEGPVRPLPLVEGQETWSGCGGYRLRRENGAWVLAGNPDGRWADLYAFNLEPQHPVDFVVANWFTSTHPSSRFVQTLTAQRSWPDSRAVLRDRELLIRDNAATRSETIRDPEHLLDVLAETFGLKFPRGTRFSRPVF